MQKCLFLIWLLFSSHAFAQNASSIRFVYIGTEGGDHGTVAICAGKIIIPADRPEDTILGKPYLTDWPTLDTIKSIIAKSKFVMDCIDERLDSFEKYKEARYDKYKIIGVGDSALYVQGESAEQLFFQLFAIFLNRNNNAGGFLAMSELLSHTHSGFMKKFLQDSRPSPAETRPLDAIEFAYRSIYHVGYPNIPHGKLTIVCKAKIGRQNNGTVAVTDDKSTIYTDVETYNFVREYILNSTYTYSAKDAEKAKKSGKPLCPYEPSLEITGSKGVDVFVCRNDWRTFFDSLRSELQMQSLDQIVIDVFSSAPNWPIPVAAIKAMECRGCQRLSVRHQDTLTLISSVSADQVSKTANSLTASTKKRGAGPLSTQPIYEKRLTKDDFSEVIRFDYCSDANLLYHTLLIGVEKHVHPNQIANNLDLEAAIFIDTGSFSLVREYALCSTYTYTAKDAESWRKAGKAMCPFETSLEMTDSNGMDLFVCHNNWHAFFDSLRSEIQAHSLDPKPIDVLKWRLY